MGDGTKEWEKAIWKHNHAIICVHFTADVYTGFLAPCTEHFQILLTQQQELKICDLKMNTMEPTAEVRREHFY